MKYYFKENETQQTSTQMIWDAAKAVFRGLAISYIIKRNKIKRQRYNNMKEEHKKLELELQNNPNNKLVKKEMNILKHKMNLIETEEMAQQIKTAKQDFFESANKPGRWLAYKLKKQKEKR